MDDEDDAWAEMYDALHCRAMRMIMTVDGAPGRCRRRACRVQRACQLELPPDGALPACRGGALGQEHAWEAMMMAVFHVEMREQGM